MFAFGLERLRADLPSVCPRKIESVERAKI
jgi:hypothetical protein